MRKRLTHLMLAIVMAIGTAAVIGAQGAGAGGAQGPPQGRRGGPGGPGRPGGPPCNGQALANALNLSADQRATFEQISKDAQTAAKPLEDQLQQLQADARAAGRGSDTAASDVAKAADLQRQLMEVRAQSRASLNEILTTDQREHLHAIEAQTTGRGGPGAGRPGGAGGRGGRGGDGTTGPTGAGPMGRPGGGPCGG